MMKQPLSCRRWKAWRFSAGVGIATVLGGNADLAIARRRLEIWQEADADDLCVARGGRLDGDALAAAAGVGLVRIVEDELGREARRLVVDLRAEQEEHRLGLDEDGDALVLDDLVKRRGGFGVFDHVLLAGAAAVLHAHAQADVAAVGAAQDLAHARRGALGERDDFRPRTAQACWGDLIHQNIFSCSLASSDIRDGSQGGSKITLTVQDLMPSISMTASSTQPGMSPATGHPGAVSVMSMATSFSSDTSTR